MHNQYIFWRPKVLLMKIVSLIWAETVGAYLVLVVVTIQLKGFLLIVIHQYQIMLIILKKL